MNARTMTDAQISWLLQKLVAASPEYAAFAQEYAFLSEHAFPDDEAASLSRDLLVVLSESPQHAGRIQALSLTMGIQQLDRVQITLPLPLMATFLLRDHIRYRRLPDQARELLIDHNPSHSPDLAQLLARIAGLLPNEVSAFQPAAPSR